MLQNGAVHDNVASVSGNDFKPGFQPFPCRFRQYSFRGRNSRPLFRGRKSLVSKRHVWFLRQHCHAAFEGYLIPEFNLCRLTDIAPRLRRLHARQIKLLERMGGIERKSAFRRFDGFRSPVRFVVAFLNVALTVKVRWRINLVPDRIVLPENLSRKSRVGIPRIQRRAADVSPAGPAFLDVRIHRHLIPPDGSRHPRILFQNQVQPRGRRQIAQTACTVVFSFAAEKLLELRSCLSQTDFPARIRIGNAPETLQNTAFRDTRRKKRLRPELRFEIAGNLKRAFRRRKIQALPDPLVCRLVFFHSDSPFRIDRQFPAPQRRLRFQQTNLRISRCRRNCKFHF